MTSRREFLSLGVSALALPISGRIALRSSGPSGSDPLPMAFYKVLFDERFAACRAFSEEARRLGLEVHAIRGDVTHVWYNDLHARWKQGPVAIAGMTQKAALFCLDVMARDQRMQLVFLREHLHRSETRADRAQAGPPGVKQPSSNVLAGGPEWPAWMARLIGRFPSQSLRAKIPPVTVPLVSAADDPGLLVSWVIAPRSAL